MSLDCLCVSEPNKRLIKGSLHQLFLGMEYSVCFSVEVLYLTLISADLLGSHYLQEFVRIGVSLVEW